MDCSPHHAHPMSLFGGPKCGQSHCPQVVMKGADWKNCCRVVFFKRVQETCSCWRCGRAACITLASMGAGLPMGGGNFCGKSHCPLLSNQLKCIFKPVKNGIGALWGVRHSWKWCTDFEITSYEIMVCRLWIVIIWLWIWLILKNYYFRIEITHSISMKSFMVIYFIDDFRPGVRDSGCVGPLSALEKYVKIL